MWCGINSTKSIKSYVKIKRVMDDSNYCTNQDKVKEKLYIELLFFYIHDRISIYKYYYENLGLDLIADQVHKMFIGMQLSLKEIATKV